VETVVPAAFVHFQVAVPVVREVAEALPKALQEASVDVMESRGYWQNS